MAPKKNVTRLVWVLFFQADTEEANCFAPSGNQKTGACRTERSEYNKRKLFNLFMYIHDKRKLAFVANKPPGVIIGEPW